MDEKNKILDSLVNSEDTLMDERCPRQLETHPESYCPLAVIRLKALRSAQTELTEEEESKLPGCPWAVNHQLSNYCFFKFMDSAASDKSLSDVEIAHLNSISVETVKDIEKKGIHKIKNSDMIKEIEAAYDGAPVDIMGTEEE